MEYAKYKAVLDSELEALIEAEAAQSLVNEAVKQRNWIDFNAAIEVVKSLAGRVEALEQKRLALTPEAAGGGKERFYVFARRFSGEEQKTLCELYRSVKFEAAKLRFSAEALSAYLGESRALVSGLLEAVFPEKRGKIYGKSGVERSAGLGGIVLDKRF